MATMDDYLFSTKHGCGRYALLHPEKIKNRFGIKGPIPVLNPNYNAAPTQIMPVVTRHENENHVSLMKWGLIPVWAKNKPSFAFTTFNAKAEGIEDKPLWKIPFKKSRCIVPANLYYEWKKVDSKTKQPYAFHLKNNELFGFAGLYNAWTDESTGEIVRTYSIITTSPNSKQKPIHDRMPVILERDEENAWLNEGETDLRLLQSFLNPYSGKDFDLHPVSVAVGNTKNNTPDLVESITIK